MTSASAPGKIILFGEHAVVYGRPAIAAPVTHVRAMAEVTDGPPDGPSSGVRLTASDFGESYWLHDAAEDALAAAVRVVQKRAQIEELPPLTIEVHSDIPIASGLGSGAATAAALIRALVRHLGRTDLAADEEVSAMTYEVEKIHHGTPSGIDNTVVALEQPVYFVRQQPRNLVEPIAVARPLRLLIGDTGKHSSTREVVGDVRRQWQANEARFEEIFDSCGGIAEAARQAIQSGHLEELGRLMQENHHWLQKMTVSSPELDELVAAAMKAGALGAKLSGAGRGGNMIALVQDETAGAVQSTLEAAGAANVLSSFVESSGQRVA